MNDYAIAAIAAVVAATAFVFAVGRNLKVEEEEVPTDEQHDRKPHTWTLERRLTSKYTNIYRCVKCNQEYELTPWNCYNDTENLLLVYKQTTQDCTH